MEYFDKSIEFESLYKGLKKSCRNVRWKNSVVGYENNGLANTLHLQEAIKSGKYKISKYQVFHIHEPKEREIVATRLVDRQFQHSLCDNGLCEDFREHFIRDNVACLPGRGTDDAINRLKIHLMRHYRKHGSEGWYLKCDIYHFFPETSHEMAKKTVRKYIADDKAYQAVCDIIDSFDGDKGIGLGSQISQYIQLAVLDELDHFIKERLCVKGYVRYADDFILLGESKEYLQYCRREIEKKLSEKGLRLNGKTTIQPLRHGIMFLQWRFLLTDTGKVIMLMNPKKITKIQKRMKKIWAMEAEGKLKHGTTKECLRSFLANAKRGNTFQIQIRMINFYESLTGGNYYDRRIPRTEIAGAENRKSG